MFYDLHIMHIGIEYKNIYVDQKLSGMLLIKKTNNINEEAILQYTLK